jgi:hypothetical protein
MPKQIKVNGRIETVVNSYGIGLRFYELASGGTVREVAPDQWVRWRLNEITLPVNVVVLE